MIFSHNREFSDSEIELVNNVLEKLLGRKMSFCRNHVEENGFLFLDHWDDKMGFVKETESKYLILSLYFEERKCSSYQVIIKEGNDKWVDGRIIDNGSVRKAGLIKERD